MTALRSLPRLLGPGGQGASEPWHPDVEDSGIPFLFLCSHFKTFFPSFAGRPWREEWLNTCLSLQCPAETCLPQEATPVLQQKPTPLARQGQALPTVLWPPTRGAPPQVQTHPEPRTQAGTAPSKASQSSRLSWGARLTEMWTALGPRPHGSVVQPIPVPTGGHLSEATWAQEDAHTVQSGSPSG